MTDLMTQLTTSPLWLTVTLLAILLLGMAEWGFRAGRQLHDQSDQERVQQISTLHGAVLGLLALLLGFTFALAANRYDLRREALVRESNAIGTTYLRADFLPESQRAPVQELLRQYVDVRLAFKAAGTDSKEIAAVDARTAVLQQALWAHAVAAARAAPTPITASFVTALNETIDLESIRRSEYRNRVPSTVWILLILVSSCGTWATGYAAGAAGKRTFFGNLMVPVLITLVLAIIIDFAAPRQGFISVDQDSLIQLQRSLGPAER